MLRAELSLLILREVSDPRVRLATVTAVHTSPDLQHARVLVSALGSEDERLACIDGLRHARGYLRSKLAASLDLRRTPELVFELDRGAEHAQRITELLEQDHDNHRDS